MATKEEVLLACKRMCSTCTRCKLASFRVRSVFGRGNPNADIMLVGFMPTRDDEMEGFPFMGMVGSKLNEVLAWAKERFPEMPISSDEVWVTNVVKCRPPDNRDAEDASQEACLDFLKSEIRLVKPKMILVLGRPATVITGAFESTLQKYRGRAWLLKGFMQEPVVIVSFHPSSLLGNKKWVVEAQNDLVFLHDLWKTKSRAV